MCVAWCLPSGVQSCGSNATRSAMAHSEAEHPTGAVQDGAVKGRQAHIPRGPRERAVSSREGWGSILDRWGDL